MVLVSKSIPNLINGVSQQPEALRLDSQCEIADNTYPSVVEGLKKRGGTHLVARLMDGVIGSAKVHTIKRDKNEKYKVFLTDGDLKVVGLDGSAKVVNFPSGKAYLASTRPETGFACMTIADYTFVGNLDKVTAMLPDLSPTRGAEALIFIKQGSADAKYTVTVDGAEKASYTLPSSSSDTLTVATELTTQLTTNLGAGWEVTRERTSIWVRKTDKSDFEIKIEDSRSNTLSDVFKGKSQKFSDLPTVAPAGMVIEIVGDSSNEWDGYFVRFECSNETASFDKGVWKETVKPGIPYKLDPATMPHGLVREADGTFTFKPLEWGERKVGDEETAELPSFVGKTLRDIFFYQNRLGLLSDENVILSEAGEFFNFFPTTVTTLVDSDPIDVPASSSKVSLLNHAIQFQEDLIFFSDLTQFLLDKGDSDILSPKGTQVISITDFESSTDASPVNGGKNLYFGVSKGGFSGVREYYVDNNTVTRDSIDITSHVPRFIPGGLYRLASSTNENIILALSAQDRKAVYAYKYFWAGQEKMQSAWVRWTFAGDVLDADFIETDLYLVVQYPDGIYLLRMSIQPGYCDQDTPFEFHLDRKVHGTSCSPSYDENTGLTTWALPYTLQAQAAVVVGFPKVAGAPAIPGQMLTLASASGNVITVAGDYSTTNVIIGEQFKMLYRFSKQTMKESAEGGGETPIGDGRLQLRYWTVQYSETGYFRAEVTPDFRDTFVYIFNGYTIGDPESPIGAVPLKFGRFKFPIMSRNDRVTIDIVNDTHLPCKLLSAEWEGDFTLRSKRL